MMWKGFLGMLDDIEEMLFAWIVPITVGLIVWVMLAHALCVGIDEFKQFAQDVHVVADSIRDADAVK